ELHAKYPLNTHEKCMAFTEELLKDFSEFKDELETFVLELFDYNGIFQPKELTSTDREYLTFLERQLDPERIPLAQRAMLQFLKALPLPKSGKSAMTVPLSALIPDVANHVSHAVHICMNTTHGEHRVFGASASDFTNIIHEISGAEMGS